MNLRSLYGGLCRSVLMPMGDLASRQSVSRHWRELSEQQWWSRERLQALQDQRLRDVVRVAYEQVPFYRELYDRAGVKPQDIRGSVDIEKLPLVNKDLLRDAYPAKCTRDSGKPFTEFCTSGSTGRPFAVRVDSETLSIARAQMLMRAEFSGWTLGQPYLQTGMTLARGAVRAVKDKLFRCAYVSAFDLSDATLDRYLEMLEGGRMKYLMGYAASMYLLARRAQAVRSQWRLDGVVSWGDNMFPHYRRAIEQQFGCRVTDTYGCGEGIQISAQCGHGDGNYHLFSPTVLTEFVREGHAVRTGEVGEILVTRLDAGAMPLIRYQIGDVGKSAEAQGCGCGRGLPMMREVSGRSTDVVVTPNGNRLIVHFFTGIFEYAKSIDTFQVLQTERSAITVKVVPKGAFDQAEWQRLCAEVADKGDPALKINLEIVAQIPLEKSNKRRFVISRLKDGEGL